MSDETTRVGLGSNPNRHVEPAVPRYERITHGDARVFVAEGMYTVGQLEKLLQDFKAVRARVTAGLAASMQVRLDRRERE